jgi:hypothetical protein
MHNLQDSRQTNHPGPNERNDIEVTSIGGQSCLVIPDPSQELKAKITEALEKGVQAIIQDSETPELVTRALLELCGDQQRSDIATYLRDTLKNFIEGVRSILEVAYSLRAIKPEIDLRSQLVRNIDGFKHIQANNLMIAVGGAILAEEVLDREVPEWREQRTKDPRPNLDRRSRREIDEHLIRPEIYRDSPIEQLSARLVKGFLCQLLRTAGAQELVGEQGRLTAKSLARIAPPIKKPVNQKIC